MVALEVSAEGVMACLPKIFDLAIEAGAEDVKPAKDEEGMPSGYKVWKPCHQVHRERFLWRPSRSLHHCR